MLWFVVVEGMRLLTITVGLITWLLILKENTMDIGLLIGASVASGFFLRKLKAVVGHPHNPINTYHYDVSVWMYYMWICAANLPVLINERELDERAATIDKLEQLVEVKHTGSYPQGMDEFYTKTNRSNLFYLR